MTLLGLLSVLVLLMFDRGEKNTRLLTWFLVLVLFLVLLWGICWSYLEKVHIGVQFRKDAKQETGKPFLKATVSNGPSEYGAIII